MQGSQPEYEAHSQTVERWVVHCLLQDEPLAKEWEVTHPRLADRQCLLAVDQSLEALE